jgi:bacillithiol system protein YtxJ
MTDITRVEDAAALDDALGAEHAVLYKHSPTCGASLVAFREVREFAAVHPDMPVYLIDVIAGAELAARAAERLGVTHESPQVIVLDHGTPVWNASHRRVTAAALAEQVDR